MSNEKEKKNRATKCGKTTDIGKIDKVVVESIRRFQDDILKSAKIANICPRRLVSRLSMSLNTFMSFMIEAIERPVETPKRVRRDTAKKAEHKREPIAKKTKK